MAAAPFARSVDDFRTLATHDNERFRVIRGVIQRMYEVLPIDTQHLVDIDIPSGRRSGSLDHCGYLAGGCVIVE